MESAVRHCSSSSQPKRELTPEFTAPRRKLSLPPLRGQLALPDVLLQEVLLYIYPKHCREAWYARLLVACTGPATTTS